MHTRTLVILLVLTLAVPSAWGTVWYVDKDNTSATKDGTSWATAFTAIQDAIDAASPAEPSEVWVAEGIYDERRGAPDGSLVLRNQVDVYGGFAGTEILRDDRDWETNVTIIDGSKAREGVAAGHAVKAANSVLDGFTVVSSSNAQYRLGAAMLIQGASPRVRNCTFQGNDSYYGSAVLCYAGCAPSFVNCVFEYSNRGYLVYLDGRSLGTYMVYDGGWQEIPAGPDDRLTAEFIACRFAGLQVMRYTRTSLPICWLTTAYFRIRRQTPPREESTWRHPTA